MLTIRRQTEQKELAELAWVEIGGAVYYAVSLDGNPYKYFNVDTKDLAEILYAHP